MGPPHCPEPPAHPSRLALPWSERPRLAASRSCERPVPCFPPRSVRGGANGLQPLLVRGHPSPERHRSGACRSDDLYIRCINDQNGSEHIRDKGVVKYNLSKLYL